MRQSLRLTLDFTRDYIIARKIFYVEAWMRGKLSAVLMVSIAVCALLAGCVRNGAPRAPSNADREIEAVLREVHTFTGEFVRKVESANDPATGVDEAQRYLDSRSEEIKVKIDALRKINDAQLSEAMRGRKMEGLMSVNGLQIKFMTKAMNDPAFKSKLERLLNDYRALVDV